MVLGGENRIFASIPRPRKRLIELMRVMVLAAAMYIAGFHPVAARGLKCKRGGTAIATDAKIRVEKRRGETLRHKLLLPIRRTARSVAGCCLNAPSVLPSRPLYWLAWLACSTFCTSSRFNAFGRGPSWWCSSCCRRTRRPTSTADAPPRLPMKPIQRGAATDVADVTAIPGAGRLAHRLTATSRVRRRPGR